MKIVSLLIALVVIGNSLVVDSANADEVKITNPWGIFINGFSYHFEDLNQQPVNLGLGVYYNLQNQVPWMGFLNKEKLALEFDVYDDSYNDIGFAIGVTWKTSLVADNVYFGLKAGLVHEDNASENAGYLIPGIVPFLELRGGSFGVRSMLVPPVGDITHGYVTLQFIVDL